MRVIDVNEAERVVAEQLAYEARMEYGGRHTADEYIDIARSYFQNLPMIDAEPVRHGKWKTHHVVSNWKEYYNCECNQCGWMREDFQPTWYCPNCGAKMDGGNNEAD